MPVAALTDRERPVLDHLSTSRLLDEIAAELDMSTSTVKSHVRSIYAKLGVSFAAGGGVPSAVWGAHTQPR